MRKPESIRLTEEKTVTLKMWGATGKTEQRLAELVTTGVGLTMLISEVAGIIGPVGDGQQRIRGHSIVLAGLRLGYTLHNPGVCHVRDKVELAGAGAAS